MYKFNYEKPYLIGEIGINHNGDVEIAKKLITLAHVSGFDAVKFQKRNPDVCVPDSQKDKPKSTPWGDMTYLEYKYKVEFGKAEYDEIDLFCKELGIAWSASPWDKDSVDFLLDYDIPWIKVASASMYDEKLLRYVGNNFEHVIISTGACDMKHLHNMYSILYNCSTEYIDVLHCNSSYPAPVKDLNLNCITTLQKDFNMSNIGYSGHEYGLSTTVATVALGAMLIERHITLDKTMWGSDQQCSLEPHAMFKLVRAVHEVYQSLGSYDKIITPKELEKMESLRK